MMLGVVVCTSEYDHWFHEGEEGKGEGEVSVEMGAAAEALVG